MAIFLYTGHCPGFGQVFFLLALLAYLPSVISFFLPKIRGARAPLLHVDLPLLSPTFSASG